MKPVQLFEVRAAIPRETGWLSERERERLSTFRLPNRRHDFRSGRWTAKRALARAFDMPEDLETLARLDIRPDDRGAPHPYLGDERLPCDLSLSHRSGATLCALDVEGSQIGCDVEWVEPRSREFEAHFMNEAERRWLEGLAPVARAEAANLLWSAKESALKGLHRGLDIDVRSIEVELHQGPDRKLSIHVPHTPHPMRGSWQRHEGWLLTVARAG